MAVLTCARAVSSPEPRSVGFEERIPFAFEGRYAGNVTHGETALLKPAAEMGFLALALGMIETAQGYLAVEDEAGVGGEDHVGRARLRLHQEHVGNLRKRAMQNLPLFCCALARGPVHVPGHPRIDDVVDVVERRRTHEKGRLATRGHWDLSARADRGTHAQVCSASGRRSMLSVKLDENLYHPDQC